ncbi:hypothetical protein [Chryseobacterium terrae]|uniref:Lipoprotein n=1 Tax=Chryseobacterium terrae TaxID=3163299 RepID=A0ABW8Y8U8_9FLAO
MKIIKGTISSILFGLLLILSSCKNNNEPATPINGEQFEKLRENKENDGKRFSITGYPYLDSDVTIHSDLGVLIDFYSQPKAQGEYMGSIKLGYKDDKNGMFIPNQFEADDLQISDNEGNQLGINDKMTVSFTMELDTNRPPHQGNNKLVKDKNGIPEMVELPATYYGDGPSNIKIEKAQ